MKVDFLIAEEIRPEAEAKLTILGLFSNSTLLINKRVTGTEENADAPVALDRIAILVTVSGVAEGTHKFKGQIFDPLKQPYNQEAHFGEAAIPDGFSHSIIIELKPFIIKVYGCYHFEFFVDDKKFVFPFECRLNN